MKEQHIPDNIYTRITSDQLKTLIQIIKYYKSVIRYSQPLHSKLVIPILDAVIHSGMVKDKNSFKILNNAYRKYDKWITDTKAIVSMMQTGKPNKS